MTVRQVQISAAITRLGDAALDPTVWPAVMDDISRAAGATGAALLQSDARTPDVPRTPAVDDLFKAYFMGNWHIRDIRARGAPLLASGERRVISDHDVVTADEMHNSAYYNDLLRPFGLRWFAAVGFRAGEADWALSIHRTAAEGPFDEAEMRLLAQLSPRLSEAATLSSALGQAVISGIGHALDLCGQPALVLGRMGFVLAANAAADLVFDTDFGPRRRRLHATDKAASGELAKLTTWLRNAPENGDIPVPTIVVRREGVPSVLIRILPVPPAAQGPFLGARVLLTLTVLAPAGASPNLLMRTYGLSRAEAKVAMLLGVGMSPANVASAAGVAVATVRNQLKAIFAKTDTHRQSELAALISRLRFPP